ncbi:hypothetical protein [Gulosibacter sp. ACHW.36C]|uniref:Lipoprotein n=1 Tax=Gulosibacter sediminis TaxID=1729695 RepID=A0ABY4MWU7_9MICO|nr:hypothetical protein [Gulosibacter sediminis]UQN14885.1 hypothetical protein M3M28_12715 [Gulosibacter sediminis]
MNLKLRRLAVIPMIGAALALTACSGAAERPTADELKSTIEEELGSTTTGLDAETQDAFLDCISQGLVDSDLSDDLLAKAANNEYGTDEERAEFEAVVTEVSTTCAEDVMM